MRERLGECPAACVGDVFGKKMESQVAKTILQMAFNAFRCLEIPFVLPQKLGSLLFLGVQLYNYRQFHVCLD